MEDKFSNLLTNYLSSICYTFTRPTRFQKKLKTKYYGLILFKYILDLNINYSVVHNDNDKLGSSAETKTCGSGDFNAQLRIPIFSCFGNKKKSYKFP